MTRLGKNLTYIVILFFFLKKKIMDRYYNSFSIFSSINTSFKIIHPTLFFLKKETELNALLVLSLVTIKYFLLVVSFIILHLINYYTIYNIVLFLANIIHHQKNTILISHPCSALHII